MDEPLIKLAQAAGLETTGVHEWPEKVDEDIAEFISNADPCAIFVIQQKDGLVIGPPPRSAEDVRVLVVVKPKGVLPAENWHQQVVSTALPLADGAAFRNIHSLLAQVVLPIFDSQVGTAGAQARHRLVEAERALAQLLRHTQVAFVDFNSGATAARAQKALDTIQTKEAENQDAPATELNELQSVVNVWKQQVTQLASSERDVKEGSVSDEIGFWLTLEAALQSVQEQLSGPLVSAIWSTLERNKRFHATHNFGGETGLTEAITRVQGYTQILFRDLPIGELVASSTLDKLIESTEAVFSHINRKLRASGYPAQRSVALAEAVGLEFCTLLGKIAETELEHIIDTLDDADLRDLETVIASIKNLRQGVVEASDIWDTQIRDFASIARDLMRRRAERFVVVRIDATHSALVARIIALDAICEKHAELLPLLESASVDTTLLNTIFKQILQTKNLLKLDENEWNNLEVRYSREMLSAEKKLANDLLKELSQAHDDEELFAIFARNSHLMSRPEVRVVTHKYQNALIKTVKRDLRSVELRSASLPTSESQIVDRVLRMQQIKIRATELKNRLQIVLGPEWRNHAEGSQIGFDCDALETAMDFKSIIDDWSNRLKERYGVADNTVNGIDGSSQQLIEISKHDATLQVPELGLASQSTLRALKALGYRFDPTLTSAIEIMIERHAAALRLRDCLASVDSLVETMTIYPRIKFSNEIAHHSHQLMAFIRLGLSEMTWASPDLSKFVYGFERAISLLEAKVNQIARIDSEITEELSSSTSDVENLKQKISDMATSVMSSEYSHAVMIDLSSNVSKRINDSLTSWSPSQCQHTVEIKTRSIQISPPLESALTEWFTELNELIKPASDMEIEIKAAYAEATTKIWQAYAAASEQVKQWTQFQPLWDRNIDEVIEKLGNNIEMTLELLNELTEAQEISSNVESAISLDPSAVSSILESKCDSWQNALVTLLVREVKEKSTDLLDLSRRARRNVESCKLDLSGLLEGMKVFINAEKVQKELKTIFPLLKATNALLTKLRFDFPPGWIFPAALEQELEAIEAIVQRREEDLEAAKPRLFKELESRIASLVISIEGFRDRWAANKPLQPQVDPEYAITTLNKFSEEVKEQKNSLNAITEAFVHLDHERPLPLKLKSLLQDSVRWNEEIQTLKEGWTDIRDGWKTLHELGKGSWFHVDPSNLAKNLRDLQTKLDELPDRTTKLRAFSKLAQRHTECMNTIEKVRILRQSDSIQFRHLVQLIPSIGSLSEENLRLSDLWTKLPDMTDILDMVETADGEFQLQKYIETVNEKWNLMILEGHDCALYNLDAVLQLSRDNLAAFKAMRASRYFSAVASSVQDWERRIGIVQQVFDKLIDVQQQYVYLRGVLTSDSVAVVLPNEAKRFKGVADEFIQIFLKSNGRSALEVAGIPRLVSNLTRLIGQFASLHRSLSGYLETQRRRFPRLYYIGDDDLLEIVGSPLTVWQSKYIPSIFPGVTALESDCVISKEGERLNLVEKFNGDTTETNNIEMLIQLELNIRQSLRVAVISAMEQLKASWPDPSKFGQWLTSVPLQAAILALREQWTGHLSVIKTDSAILSQYEAWYLSIMQWLASAGDDSLLWMRRRESGMAELTYELNHLRLKSQVLALTVEMSGTEQGEAVIRWGNYTWPYGYEYLGAYEPIVQTSVTDDLFIDAVSAIAQEKGGSIIGPAGTGKTETVKALGAIFGRRVIVFNCDNQFDFVTMSRVMAGCVATKSWVCFDEFNRLTKGVLSSVAQVINEKARSTPVFVTMNPGYSGRTTLPPNMREQFREFVLENPDARSIARVLLCAHGRIAPEVADSTVKLLESMESQASKQKHYDWGLRALKGVLRVCRQLRGNMKLAFEIAIRPRLVPEDRRILDTEMNKLVPSYESAGGYEKLTHLGNYPNETDMTLDGKLLPYVETLSIFCNLFPGTMLLGPSGSGKTAIRKELANISGAETVIIDPSAVSKSTLLGAMDPITREWKDGILSGVIRKVLSNLRGEQKNEWFIVFDGEIESEWAEALNSVLDDNRHLTLANGEILPLPNQVHLVFETTNLDSATPATISRCGIICIPDDLFDLSISSVSPKLMKVAESIHHAMEFSESRAQVGLSTLDLGNKWLTTAWVLAGDSDDIGRARMSDAIRDVANDKLLPKNGSLTNYYVSDLTGRWHSWLDSICSSNDLQTDAVVSPDVVIPTADTASNEAILQSALTSHLPLLLVGPPGSGKTMTLFNALRNTHQLLLIPLNFSSTASPELVIQALKMHCEISLAPDGSKVLSPPGSKWAVLFIDEINLPQPRNPQDSKVVPVLQFLRHLIEYQGFWDSNGEFVKVERVQHVGACNPPPQRKPLPNSLLRHYLVINVGYPSRSSLHTIYRAYLSTFGAENLVEPMLRVYDELSSTLPTETWTPRELTRWMRGIFTGWIASSEANHTSQLLSKLWLNEACRVLGDRLKNDEKSKIYDLLYQNYPIGQVDISREQLDTYVWTSLMSQRPKFFHIDEFRQFLEARLFVFAEEASGEADIHLCIHNEFVQHVSRIERILRQPQGHALLVGPPSVGKSTSVKFTSWLVGMDFETLRSHSRYSDADFGQDLRRILTSAMRRPICVQLGDDLLVVPEFVERINSLLANGEVPGLFDTTEQLSDLEERCFRAGFDGGDLMPWFRSRIVQNLHVVFITSNLEHASTALLNRCVVNRVEPWSVFVKKQIASSWCSTIDVSHGCVETLAMLPPLEISQNIPHGGMSFIEACRQFVRLYNTSKLDLEESQRHFVSGSDRLKSTVLEISQLKKTLALKKQQLKEESKRSSEVLSQMLREQSEAERKRVAAVEIRAAVQAQTHQIEERQRETQQDLAATEPLIKQAAEGVQNIKKSQLNELRSLMNPPEPVKITLEAVCLVLGLKTDGSWRQVLAAVRGDEFIPRIVNFDSNTMSESLISKIEREYMSIPSFTYERVDRASKAGGPLLRWVVAQVAYGRAIAAIQPLLNEIEDLNEQSSESRTQLSTIESMLVDLEEAIEKSKREYGVTVAHCETLKTEMHNVTSQLTRAESLLESLSEENERWTSASKDFLRNMSLLPGKALIEASLIGMSGRLDPKEKQLLVQYVKKLAEENDIKMADEMLLAATGNVDTNQHIIEHSWSIVLVIDPANRWEPHTASESNLKITSFLLDPDILGKELDAALRFGQTLVIQNAERFDPLIMPLLTRNFSRKGSRLFVNLGSGDVDVAAGFRLMLHSRDLESIVNLSPFILSRVNIVDYSVTVNKFQHMVGDALLSAQMPELARRRTDLQNVDIETTRRLRDLEHQLLTELSESSATEKMLENQGLVHSLEKLKAETLQLKQTKSSTRKTLDELEDAFRKFTPQAKLAANIFEQVGKLRLIDKFYMVGVDWLWEIVLRLADSSEFAMEFTSEVRSRAMSVVKRSDWDSVSLISSPELPESDRKKQLTLIDIIGECSSKIPIVAGMATINAEDPAQSIVHFNSSTSIVAMGSAQSVVLADRLLSQAMELGEWLVIQNIEIANEEWLRNLARRLQTASPSSKFRLVLTGLQSELIAIPDLIAAGRPVSVERLHGIKVELLDSLTPASDNTDFLICWINACLSQKFSGANLSRNDLAAARWFVQNTPDSRVLSDLLVKAVWGAKTVNENHRALMHRFVNDILEKTPAGLPTSNFQEWAYQLPDDSNWLPTELSA